MLFVRQIITLVGQTQAGLLDLSKFVMFHRVFSNRINVADNESNRLSSLTIPDCQLFFHVKMVASTEEVVDNCFLRYVFVFISVRKIICKL